MGIFNKATDKPSTGGIARDAVQRLMVSGENGISLIGPGMQVKGELLTEGTVRVEGTVEGTIRAGKSVVVGQGGAVVGDIITRDAVIAGRVSGTVNAGGRVELQNTAILDGEIRTRVQHLQLDEGALFTGQIYMLEEDAEPLKALPRGLREDEMDETSPQLVQEA